MRFALTGCARVRVLMFDEMYVVVMAPFLNKAQKNLLVDEQTTDDATIFHFLIVGLFFFLLLGDGCRVLIRHFALDPDKVGHFARGVAEGRNEELIPEGGPVDTVVEQTDGHVVALLDGLADAFDVLGIRLGALQEAAIAAQNLVERVSRQVEETLRSVDDRIVRKAGVGDDKVLLGRLEGLDEGEIGVVQDLVGDSLRGGE